MFHQFVTWTVNTIGHWGYPGIGILMFLESSFFPFPSEVVIPPAGYLASVGEMNLGLVLLSGIAGSLLGAVFNYWLAMRYGRPFFDRYGRYLLVSKRSLEKADRFFADHGHISTFIGRLLPGIRQYISLPAGLASMNFLLFCLFTILGAGIWVMVLALVGYWFGRNQALVMTHIHWISIILAISCITMALAYIVIYRRRSADRKGK